MTGSWPELYSQSNWYKRSVRPLGKGVPQDVDKAKDLLTGASACGVAEATFELARLHLNESFEAADPTARREWLDSLTTASAAGVAQAQYELARLHLNGGIEGADPIEGREYLIQAAQNGSAEATTLLRSLAGAEQGDAYAQSILGDMYAQGQGVEPDDAEAARWRLKAAEQGDADEQFMLGNMYARGWGVEQVYAKASHWWRKAAEQGNAYAQFNLGDMYFLGRGVQQDHAKARRWWRKAADQGNAAAQFNLGLQYAKGVGVPQDDAKAVRPRGSLENRPMRITSKAANGREAGQGCYTAPEPSTAIQFRVRG